MDSKEDEECHLNTDDLNIFYWINLECLAMQIWLISTCFSNSFPMLQIKIFRMASDFSVWTEQGWSEPEGWLAFSKDPQWGFWGKITKKHSIL